MFTLWFCNSSCCNTFLYLFDILSWVNFFLFLICISLRLRLTITNTITISRQNSVKVLPFLLFLSLPSPCLILAFDCLWLAWLVFSLCFPYLLYFTFSYFLLPLLCLTYLFVSLLYLLYLLYLAALVFCLLFLPCFAV